MQAGQGGGKSVLPPVVSKEKAHCVGCTGSTEEKKSKYERTRYVLKKGIRRGGQPHLQSTAQERESFKERGY